MSKLLKITLAIVGTIVVGISVLVLSFNIGMKPDKKEEDNVVKLAEEYLEEYYEHDEFEIYDVLYDNMGNFPEFEYAAKVRNLNNGEEFLVYYDDQSDRVLDSIRTGIKEYNWMIV